MERTSSTVRLLGGDLVGTKGIYIKKQVEIHKIEEEKTPWGLAILSERPSFFQSEAKNLVHMTVSIWTYLMRLR